MRVLMTPYFNDNQYQNLLIDAISDAGVTVETQDAPHPLSVFVHRLVADDIDALHLHWTHPFFLVSGNYGDYFDRIPFSSVGTALFAVVFLLQVAVASVWCDQIIWTLHNRMNHERAYPRVDRGVSLLLARLVDTIQVWDERTCEEAASMLRLSGDRIIAVPHGHYCDIYPDAECTQRHARERLGVDKDEFVFLYFGRIRPYKQIPRLITEFQRLELSDTRLLVVGSPDSDALEANVRAVKRSDAVDLRLEYVPENIVPVYFRAADVAVFPYRHVFNSGSVLLAMSLGRAFISPPFGAIPSVDSGGNILYDDLKNGLQRAYLAGRESLATVGSDNREYVLEHNDWDEIGSRFVALYRGS